MLRTGLSLNENMLSRKDFEEMARAGITHCEISICFLEYPNVDYKMIKSLSSEYGVDIWSYHLPYSSPIYVDIASLDKEVLNRSLDLLSDVIEKGTDIGIDKFVIHPSSEPKASDTKKREEELKRSAESLAILAEKAYRCGAVIAVENLPRSCLAHTSDELLRLVSVDERIRVCFDTNHVLYEDPIAFIDKIADKLITVHVSDYDFEDERHWLPGEGKVDWIKLYQKLIDCGYRGVWLYEVRLPCPGDVARKRDLTYRDFTINSESIFSGKIPVVL